MKFSFHALTLASAIGVTSCASTNVSRLAEPEAGQARVIHGIMDRRGAFDWNIETVTYVDGKRSENNFWRISSEQGFDLPPGRHLMTIVASANKAPLGAGGPRIWESTVTADLIDGKSYVPKARREGDFGTVWMEEFGTGRRASDEARGVAKALAGFGAGG